MTTCLSRPEPTDETHHAPRARAWGKAQEETGEVSSSRVSALDDRRHPASLAGDDHSRKAAAAAGVGVPAVRLHDPSALADDASVLPVPSHVVLHHLSTSAIRNGVLAVANTTRYRKKGSWVVFELSLSCVGGLCRRVGVRWAG